MFSHKRIVKSDEYQGSINEHSFSISQSSTYINIYTDYSTLHQVDMTIPLLKIPVKVTMTIPLLKIPVKVTMTFPLLKLPVKVTMTVHLLKLPVNVTITVPLLKLPVKVKGSEVSPTLSHDGVAQWVARNFTLID